MIYAIVGKPGTGKSYTLVRVAKEFLSKGVDVYSNVVIDEKLLNLKPKKSFFGKIQELGKLYYWTSLEQFRFIHNGIVLLDEAGAYFEPREWAKFTLEDRVKFQQHRKQKLDIYLTVQNFSRVDAVIRQLTNYVIECHKIGPLFLQRTYAPEDMDLKKRKGMGTKMFLFNAKLASAYDTYAMINIERVYYTFKKMSDFFDSSSQNFNSDSSYPEKERG